MTAKRQHMFTKGDGTVREYLWVTDMHCPTCDPHEMDPNRVHGVISDVDGTLVTECLNCADEQRHRSNDFHFLHPPPKGYKPPMPGELPPGVPRRQGE